MKVVRTMEVPFEGVTLIFRRPLLNEIEESKEQSGATVLRKVIDSLVEVKGQITDEHNTPMALEEFKRVVPLDMAAKIVTAWTERIRELQGRPAVSEEKKEAASA